MIELKCDDKWVNDDRSCGWTWTWPLNAQIHRRSCCQTVTPNTQRGRTRLSRADLCPYLSIHYPCNVNSPPASPQTHFLKLLHAASPWRFTQTSGTKAPPGNGLSRNADLGTISGTGLTHGHSLTSSAHLTCAKFHEVRRRFDASAGATRRLQAVCRLSAGCLLEQSRHTAREFTVLLQEHLGQFRAFSRVDYNQCMKVNSQYRQVFKLRKSLNSYKLSIKRMN